jgi:hypothetical protein
MINLSGLKDVNFEPAKTRPKPAVALTCFFVSVVLLSACDAKNAAVTEPSGRWQKIVEIHPQDRTKAVQMMRPAENRLPGQKDVAALVLSCQKGETEAYIIWRQYLGTFDLDVTWRAGTAPESTEVWALSTDNEAVFSPAPIAFIKQLMIYDILMVKTTPFSSEPLTLVFDTTGLDQEIDEFRTACKW